MPLGAVPLVVIALVALLGFIAYQRLRELREEPCCSPRAGCNERDYVMDRKCEYEQALKLADPLERPVLEATWERLQRTPRWAAHSYGEAERAYERVRDSILASEKMRVALAD